MPQKKILLVYLTMTCHDALPEEIGRRYRYTFYKNARLSLEYLAAVIEAKGDPVDIIDQSVHWFTAYDIITTIQCGKYLFVGFYVNGVIVEKTAQFIKTIKEKSTTPLVCGGPGTIQLETLLTAGCDIVCCGEGENTIVDVVAYFKRQKQLDEIQGIAFMRKGVVITTEQRLLIANLDTIPFPVRNKIPLLAYNDYYLPTLRKPYAVVITSRGCPYRCTYCFSHCWWCDTYRVRSVENVLQEIDELHTRHGVRYIIFRDDVFGYQYKWLEEFCVQLKKRRYLLKWMCNFYPRAYPDKIHEAIALMGDAGCDFIHIGLPSANRDILKSIGRGESEPRLVRTIIPLAKKANMMVMLEFIFGLPGETEETIKETIHYARSVKPHLVNYNPLGIAPLTALYYNGDRSSYMPAQVTQKWCRYATRRHYLNLNNGIMIFWLILKKNPIWLINIVRFLIYW
ncbi:MAG: B12-binding domain-containing radical SAM protein [Candidatus Omnitrophica bacterium]|nr:B12-binding domain-containing radical SAM protein [Candidatus Omnitrophota bacterium]